MTGCTICGWAGPAPRAETILTDPSDPKDESPGTEEYETLICPHGLDRDETTCVSCDQDAEALLTDETLAPCDHCGRYDLTPAEADQRAQLAPESWAVHLPGRTVGCWRGTRAEAEQYATARGGTVGESMQGAATTLCCARCRHQVIRDPARRPAPVGA